MAGPKKKSLKRGTRKEESKDPKAPCKEHAMLKTSDPGGYWSIMDQEDLSLIRIAYCIPKDFELELSGPNARVDSPPPGRLGVYKEAFKARLRFPIYPFT